MRVRDVMTPRPFTVTTETQVSTAIRLLAEHCVTALPVVDARSRVVGIVSEVDLIAGRIHPNSTLEPASSPNSAGARVRDRIAEVMTTQTILAHPETDLKEVERTMVATGFKSLPVVDAAHQVVGMVSRSDVVRALGRDDESLQEDITDALASAGFSRFHVDVRNGVVLLSIPEPRRDDEHIQILDLVSSTPGVKAVHAC